MEESKSQNKTTPNKLNAVTRDGNRNDVESGHNAQPPTPGVPECAGKPTPAPVWTPASSRQQRDLQIVGVASHDLFWESGHLAGRVGLQTPKITNARKMVCSCRQVQNLPH